MYGNNAKGYVWFIFNTQYIYPLYNFIVVRYIPCKFQTSFEKREKYLRCVSSLEKKKKISCSYFKIINCLQLSYLFPSPPSLSSLRFFINLSSAFNVIFCTIRANFHGSIMRVETTSIARFFYPIFLSTPQLWWKEEEGKKKKKTILISSAISYH